MFTRIKQSNHRTIKQFVLLAALGFSVHAFGAFSYQAEVTVGGFAGDEPLTNFPVLVRVSEARLPGFRFSQCRSDGADFEFSSPDGTVVYPHELDTWNVDGESLFWVSVPELKDQTTAFTVCWGDPDHAAPSVDATNVWSRANYAAVWHFSEEATAATAATTAAKESAKHNADLVLDAVPTNRDNDAACLANMVSVTGVAGRGRITTCNDVTEYNGYLVPDYDALAVGKNFTLSTFHMPISGNHLIARRSDGGSTGTAAEKGYYLFLEGNGRWITWGEDSSGRVDTYVDGNWRNSWDHLVLSFSDGGKATGGNLTTYFNGKRIVNAGSNAWTDDNGKPLMFGNSTICNYSQKISFDETRIRYGNSTAMWVTNEYATIMEPAYTTLASVQPIKANTLTVTSSSEEYGTVSPAYGTHDVAAGTPVACTAPSGELVLSSDLKVVFDGVTEQTWDASAGDWTAGSYHAGTSYDYSHTAGSIARLTWKETRLHRLGLSVNDLGRGSITVSSRAAAATEWVREDTPATLTAVPASGCKFVSWIGDTEGLTGLTSPTLTVPMSAARDLVATFAYDVTYDWKAELTVSEYAGTETLVNFPVLVRISESRISGFFYSLCQADGKDIQFASSDGSVIYDHEIEWWNPLGESLVWVKIPSLANGLKIRFSFGCAALAKSPSIVRDVWKDANDSFYAGVWHFGEEATAETAATVKAKDSAVRDSSVVIDGVPQNGNDDTSFLAEAVSVDTGAIGRARRVQSSAGNSAATRNILYFGDLDPLGLGTTVTLSWWMYADNGAGGNPFNRCDSSGRCFETLLETNERFHLSGTAGNGVCVQGTVDKTAGWTHIVYMFDGKYLNGYQNGAYFTRNTATISDTTGIPFTIGNYANFSKNAYRGLFDEVRIMRGTVSADWIKAEYDTVANASFVTTTHAAIPSGEDMMIIAGSPESIGSVTPDYGVVSQLQAGKTYTNVVNGARQLLSADDAIVFSGWDLYDYDSANEQYVYRTSGTGLTNIYTHVDGDVVKLVWKYDHAYPITLSETPAGAGTYTAGGESVQPGVVWELATDALTLVATAKPGYTFIAWTGEGIGTVYSPTLTVPVTQAAAYRAVYLANAHTPVRTAWTGSGTANWLDVANWSAGDLPNAGDEVVITAKNAKVTLETAMPRFASLTVSNATLSVRNWTTCVAADDVRVGPGGTICCEGAFGDDEMSNRVWIAANTLTVEADGKISADAAGWGGYSGPSWEGVSHSSSYAAAYGGAGAYPIDRSVAPKTYGSAEWPLQPGSGSDTDNYPGGGAILLEVAGSLVVDGRVSADAKPSGPVGSGGASGGGVAISCETVAGSGTVSASAGQITYLDYLERVGCAGGGGRVAVHYDTAKQATTDCRVRFEARGGTVSGHQSRPGQSTDYYSSRGSFIRGGLGEPGTIWFSDNSFLTSSAAYQAAGYPFAGSWTGAVALTEIEWDAAARTFDDTWLVLPAGIRLTAEGSLTMTGSWDAIGYGLVLSNATVSIGGDLTLVGSGLRLTGGSFSIAGDFNQRQGTAVPTASMKVGRDTGTYENTGSELRLYPDENGLSLTVGGTWTLENHAVVYPFTFGEQYCRFKAGNFSLDATSAIDANEKGYAAGTGPAPGMQVVNYTNVGGSHGGKGGLGNDSAAAYAQVGETYGDRKKPCEPGSGGNFRAGGGVVWLTVDGTLTVDGIIRADAGAPWTDGTNGRYEERPGSGGSIYLSTSFFEGATGLISAKGGSNNIVSGKGFGGGGRIAIICRVNHAPTWETGDEYVSAAGGISIDGGIPAYPAEDGTVYWHFKRGLSVIVR